MISRQIRSEKSQPELSLKGEICLIRTPPEFIQIFHRISEGSKNHHRIFHVLLKNFDIDSIEY